MPVHSSGSDVMERCIARLAEGMLRFSGLGCTQRLYRAIWTNQNRAIRGKDESRESADEQIQLEEGVKAK